MEHINWSDYLTIDRIAAILGIVGFFYSIRNYVLILLHTLVDLLKRKSEVTFIYAPQKDTSTPKVVVAGTFNRWLHSKEGRIRPVLWDRKKYRLRKEIHDGQEFWIRTIKILPGEHEFKFVTGDMNWYGWDSNQYYEKGNDAPGGYNLKLSVQKNQSLLLSLKTRKKNRNSSEKSDSAPKQATE
ncbi:MAG: glycogen-binding domain-containing protein [Marinifilaceae bacterium]